MMGDVDKRPLPFPRPGERLPAGPKPPTADPQKSQRYARLRTTGGILGCILVAVPAGVFFFAWFFSQNGGVPFDFTPISAFFDVQVNNNTSRPVTIADCYGRDCKSGIGVSFRDTLDPWTGRGEAAWNNDTGGLAEIRVSSGTKTIGCFKIRFRKGQQHATVNVTSAMPCSAPATVR
jgi:hypothetical protein